MDTRIDQSLSDTRPIRIQTALFSEDAGVLAAGLSPEAPLPDLSSVIEENVHEFQEEPSPHLPADATLKLPWEETAPAIPNPPASLRLRKMCFPRHWQHRKPCYVNCPPPGDRVLFITV